MEQWQPPSAPGCGYSMARCLVLLSTASPAGQILFSNFEAKETLLHLSKLLLCILHQERELTNPVSCGEDGELEEARQSDFRWLETCGRVCSGLAMCPEPGWLEP